MTEKTLKYALRILVLLIMPLFSSCLFKNDMSYPKILGEVLEFEVEGQKSVKIDKEKRTIEVVLEETADIKSVNLKVFKTNPEAECKEVFQGMNIDLSSTVGFVLKTYQEYDWKIVTSQPVERYVKCDGIVGDLIIDVSSRRITVPVSDKISLLSVTLTGLKFEPEGSRITFYEEDTQEGEVKRVPMPELPLTLDCNKWRYFIVEYKGSESRWGVNLVHKEVNLSVTEVNAWAKKVDVSGILADPAPAVLQYRKKGEEQWTEHSELNMQGTQFTATIPDLLPETEYEVKVVSGDESSAEVSFVTEQEATLQNMSLDNWYQGGKNGKIWYPNAEGAEQIWDSANPGSGNFGFITTTPVEDVAVPGDGAHAAQLESLKAVIAFAAGNIFTGKFVSIDGKGAILDWGVPFTSRPSSLKGYYKYSPKKINEAEHPDYSHLKGQTDIARIMVFITDWDKPFTVKTREGKFVDLENDEHIIAYGQLEESSEVTDYKEFKIDLEYRDTKRKPKYIVIVASSSKYGDYFVGAVGSKLWLDNFELIY